MPAVFLAFFAAALWGLWWIPIRAFEAAGLPGAWGGVAMTAGAFAAAGLWSWARGISLRLGRRALIGAGLVGVAVATYSASINYSDVVRVVLLFYLAPAWSKIIETAFMGARWTRTATLALLLSFSGAYLILGAELSLSDLRLGDGLAILSGIAWAAGAALVFSDGSARALPLSTVTAAAAVLVSVAFLPLAPPPEASAATVALALGSGAVYALPILFLTLWAARRLAPATLTFLLTAEIVSGVGSGAILLDEPFGPVQIAGTVLILSEALIEVASALRNPLRSGAR